MSASGVGNRTADPQVVLARAQEAIKALQCDPGEGYIALFIIDHSGTRLLSTVPEPGLHALREIVMKMLDYARERIYN